jgi:hypothetical protein
MLTTKDSLFLALVLMLFFIGAKGAVMIGPKLEITPDAAIVICSIAVVGVLSTVYFMARVGRQCTRDNFQHNDSKTLQNGFELTGPKVCDGGPYLWGEKLTPYCSQFTEQQLSCANCNPPYIGAPIGFQFTPDSNALWQNERTSKLELPLIPPKVFSGYEKLSETYAPSKVVSPYPQYPQ